MCKSYKLIKIAHFYLYLVKKHQRIIYYYIMEIFFKESKLVMYKAAKYNNACDVCGWKTILLYKWLFTLCLIKNLHV